MEAESYLYSALCVSESQCLPMGRKRKAWASLCKSFTFAGVNVKRKMDFYCIFQCSVYSLSLIYFPVLNQEVNSKLYRKEKLSNLKLQV